MILYEVLLLKDAFQWLDLARLAFTVRWKIYFCTSVELLRILQLHAHPENLLPSHIVLQMLLDRIYLRLLTHQSLHDTVIFLLNLFLHIFVGDLAMGSMPHQHFRGRCADLLWQRRLYHISAGLWAQLIFDWRFWRDQKGRDHSLFFQILRWVYFRDQAVFAQGTAQHRLEELLIYRRVGHLEDFMCLTVGAWWLIIVVNVVDTGSTFHDAGQAISHRAIVVLPKFINLLQS